MAVWMLLTIEPMTPGRTALFVLGVIVAWLVYAVLYTLVDVLVERFADLVESVRLTSPYARPRGRWEGFDHHELRAHGRIRRP